MWSYLAITTASKKAKARTLQNKLREELLKLFPELHVDDIKSTPMGVQGEDVQLSPAARQKLPYQFECKSMARFVGYTIMDQAKSHGKYKPVSVIKADRKQPLVMLQLNDFLELLEEAKK